MCKEPCMEGSLDNTSNPPTIAWCQVAVDISTPPEVFDTVRAELKVWLKTNAGEYSGNFLCVANFAGDPLKYTLCVWWEYSHSGACLPRVMAFSSTQPTLIFVNLKL